MRQQVIQQQHKGRKYSEQELSGRLWELVRASEKFTERAHEDSDAAERPLMQQSAQAAQYDAAPQMRQPISSPQEAPADIQRRKGVFEDIGVPQQAAWCAPMFTCIPAQ